MTSQPSASGLPFEQRVVVNGKEAMVQGQTVIEHDTDWLNVGTQFNSDKDRSQAFSLLIACARIINAWNEGIIGLQQGVTRRLTTPPELACSTAGASHVIPTNATFILK